MKKFFLKAFLFILFSLIILSIGTTRDEALDPSVKSTLESPTIKVPDEENAFIALNGFTELNEKDIIKAGQKFLKTGSNLGNKDINTQILNFYKNPCFMPNTENCLSKILEDAAIIDETIKNNEVLIERYQYSHKLPFYINTHSQVYTPISHHWLIRRTVELISAKNILEIKRGNISAVLNSIEKETVFLKNIILKSQEISLDDLELASDLLNLHMMTIHVILEDESIELKDHYEKIKEIISFDLDSKKIMANALKGEKKTKLTEFNYLIEHEFTIKNQDNIIDKFYIFYNKLFIRGNICLNNIAREFDNDIRDLAEASMLNFPAYYKSAWNRQINYHEPKSIKEFYNRYGVFFFKNILGETLEFHPNYIRSLAMFNDDCIVHSNLLRAQIELRMQPQKVQNIAEALANMGPECKNPYTEKDFQWDEEKNTIWFENSFDRNGTKIITEISLPSSFKN